MLLRRYTYLSKSLTSVETPKNQAASRKAIREYPEGLLWMALSETKQAALESRIKKSKGVYFMDTLKRLAKLRPRE